VSSGLHPLLSLSLSFFFISTRATLYTTLGPTTMMNTTTWAAAPVGGYTTVEMLLDDVSKQMASSNMVRVSRGSAGQRPAGTMRIVKPNSASNSPRGSMGLGRRRTVMNDGAYRRRLAMMDQSLLAAGGFIPHDGLQIPQQQQPQPRTSRPVSWHPTSHLVPQQSYQSYATPETTLQYQLYDLPRTPSVYSGYASPDSTFSPLSLPYVGHEQSQYYSIPQNYFSTAQFVSQQQQQQQLLSHEVDHSISQATMNEDASMYSHFVWNHFAENGFENSSTTPPTPDNFLPIQHPEPAFPSEDSIPYYPLEDNESDDGEELIGMGLYDAPEIAKSPSADPQLENYRALMMSSLLGSGYIPPRRVEPTGKGLKLEETWTPPSDDEDQDDDDEQDGEGEDEEPDVNPNMAVQNSNAGEVSPGQTGYENSAANQAYNRDGWL